MISLRQTLGIAVAFASVPAAAQDGRESLRSSNAEVAVAVLAHGIRKPFRSPPPPGFDLYEGEEEGGTADVEIVYRSPPLAEALKPRLTAKLQLNTAGGTSFASIGAEWRQHFLRDRFYVQTGVGLTIHDGYTFTPNPFAPGLSTSETMRRVDLFNNRTSFGSRVLLNPNLSLGLRMSDLWTVEAAFEHYSHAGIFSAQNPGINTVGLRLVYGLARRW